MIFLKIYGLERSGTNYLEYLVRENLKDVHVFKDGNVTGWKHGTPPSKIDWTGNDWDRKPVNPKVIESYKESIRGLEDQIEHSFCNKEIICLICFRDPYSWMYNNVNMKNIFTWNCKNKIFFNFYKSYKNSYLIKHDDLIQNNKKIINDLSSIYNLKINNNFVDLEQTIKSRHFITRDIFDKNFYIEKKYLSKINLKYKKMIKKNIDKKLMYDIGFKNYVIEFN
jgi:hypothetical protein